MLEHRAGLDAKILDLPDILTFIIIIFQSADSMNIEFKRKLHENPQAWLAVFLASGHTAMGYISSLDQDKNLQDNAKETWLIGPPQNDSQTMRSFW